VVFLDELIDGNSRRRRIGPFVTDDQLDVEVGETDSIDRVDGRLGNLDEWFAERRSRPRSWDEQTDAEDRIAFLADHRRDGSGH
jgi:hypothetical protein